MAAYNALLPATLLADDNVVAYRVVVWSIPALYVVWVGRRQSSIDYNVIGSMSGKVDGLLLSPTGRH